MIIKPSASIRQNYNEISNICRESAEPIYLTKNGEGDLVVMSIEAFEKREKLIDMRMKVLKAEEERIRGDKTLSLSDVKKQLEEVFNEI